MRAVFVTGKGGPEVLQLRRVAVPEPGKGQVRIRIHAAGVNPVDWKMRERGYPSAMANASARIAGFDAAGVIDKVGEGVSAWKVGDAVIAALQHSPHGSYAEYAVVPDFDLAMKPSKLSFEEAAGIPTAGIAAWRSLVEAGNVQRGQRVLIHGGAGGVGTIAVQIAKARGAYVIATASAANHEYLKSLGVDQTIDYRVVKFEDVIKDADAVLDTIGGETLQRSVHALKKGGILLGLTGMLPPEHCEAGGIRCWAAGAPPPGAPIDQFGGELGELSKLADAGKLRITVSKIFPLEEAAQAQELSQQGHARGKIVLRVTP
jgi:NADPH:quinone reductase-like Zn-dependent oxidoreductase